MFLVCRPPRGADPIGDAWVQFPVGFYLVALLFIVFDALAVFLAKMVALGETLGIRGEAKGGSDNV